MVSLFGNTLWYLKSGGLDIVQGAHYHGWKISDLSLTNLKCSYVNCYQKDNCNWSGVMRECAVFTTKTTKHLCLRFNQEFCGYVLINILLFFLDAIASPSTHPSQWVSQFCFWISEIAIASTELARLFVCLLHDWIYFNEVGVWQHPLTLCKKQEKRRRLFCDKMSSKASRLSA